MPTRLAKKATSGRSTKDARKWSAAVDTDSTSPPEGLFNKDATAIARTLASKKTSPKGPASGMRMLTFYVNRAGKNLSATRLRELDRAKKLLHAKVEAEKTVKKSSSARKKSAAKGA